MNAIDLSAEIHTTGAILRPQKIVDVLGNVIWVWTVVEFTGDSYKDSEIYNPKETAESLKELLVNTTTE